MQEVTATENRPVRATGNDKISSSIRAESEDESNNQNPSSIVTSISSLVCRICHTNTVHEALISPCYCKGSLAYVHLSCLERWLNQSSRNYCELCMYQYNAVQTQRYGLIEGIRMWIMHPRNRTHIQSDVLILVLLTIVTVGLIVVCLLGIHYFEIEGEKIGISKNWTKGAIIFFLCIVVVGYLITLYLMIKDQVVPWYQWWKRTLDVRLLLTPSVLDDSINVQRQNRETSV
ncbi:E3 ubiquitin-protein ligase MARCH3-like [Agrilus planipennis]|uniref:E3 ubiquitin-protein ligase MARCH3-like n=1 Tax=Agrilus planipennis TaxID=224129 RepID=A0A1W4WAK0_AGRPL|nr:E3 ubiquitin-protein ligase MARCH3-like [Agrilus planipennis]